MAPPALRNGQYRSVRHASGYVLRTFPATNPLTAHGAVVPAQERSEGRQRHSLYGGPRLAQWIDGELDLRCEGE